MKNAALCCERRPYTPPSGVMPPRSFITLLRTGNLAAHAVHRLMLLDPSPDMVHGSALRKTRSSTQDYELIRKKSTLRRGIHPCCSGLQVQGAAISPAGMAYFHSRRTATMILYHIYEEFARGLVKIQRNFTFGVGVVFGGGVTGFFYTGKYRYGETRSFLVTRQALAKARHQRNAPKRTTYGRLSELSPSVCALGGGRGGCCCICGGVWRVGESDCRAKKNHRRRSASTFRRR